MQVLCICGKMTEVRSFYHQGNLHVFCRPRPATGADCKGKKCYEKELSSLLRGEFLGTCPRDLVRM